MTVNVRDFTRFMEGGRKPVDKGVKLKGWSSQGARPTIFVPMATIGQMGENGKDGVAKVPHTMDVITRGKFISRVMNDGWKMGGLGTSYRAYFWGVIFFAMTVVSYLYIHVYLAAVFAYLTGYMRSQYLMNHAWNVEWFKGKSLIHTS
ncbi:hypothetical protein COX85_03810 [Candidatus Micrarchaeota archaeon CG_4_10_14_0_2_um_filter_55_9]|nr:MAG: hypothetical protein COX85_03810 [Candidatus Micrarchaeota archaeon CG_4_10_14_0_2_um_filter_55_9]